MNILRLRGSAASEELKNELVRRRSGFLAQTDILS